MCVCEYLCVMYMCVCLCSYYLCVCVCVGVCVCVCVCGCAGVCACVCKCVRTTLVSDHCECFVWVIWVLCMLMSNLGLNIVMFSTVVVFNTNFNQYYLFHIDKVTSL